MGGTNMKGFVMSLQKRGKVHHTILVEQVRVTSSDISSDLYVCMFLFNTCISFLPFSISAQIFMAERR